MVYLVKPEDGKTFMKTIGLAGSGGIYRLNGDIYYQFSYQTIKALNECGLKMEIYEAREYIAGLIPSNSKLEKISINSLPEIPLFMKEEHEEFKKSLKRKLNLI